MFSNVPATTLRKLMRNRLYAANGIGGLVLTLGAVFAPTLRIASAKPVGALRHE